MTRTELRSAINAAAGHSKDSVCRVTTTAWSRVLTETAAAPRPARRKAFDTLMESGICPHEAADVIIDVWWAARARPIADGWVIT